jgi:hypothetical protein
VLDDVARRIDSLGGLLYTTNWQHTGWVVMWPLYAHFVEEGLPPRTRALSAPFAKNHAGLFGIMTCSLRRRWRLYSRTA